MDLEVQLTSHEGISVVRCYGKLVYGPEAMELVRATRQALETSKEIVLHMAGVTHIDSGGVGALGAAFIAAHNRGAEIKLSALHPRVADILRITGLDLLFDIRNSESDAVTAFLRKEKPATAILEGVSKTG